MKSLLLLEDDKSLGETLFERLSKDYKVYWVQTISEAQTLFNSKTDLDLLILDLSLPDGSGFNFASWAKQQKPLTAFIFLTAQGDAESRLKGYELGAAEFIPKPFHLKELLIRVKHVLDSHTEVNEIVLEACTINFTTMSISQKDGRVDYPALSDMKLLQFLVEQSPRPVSRDEILDYVWGVDKNPNHRTVDNSIVRLKKSLGPEADKKLRSVRGLGYQWIKEGTTDV
jgi:two-component system phosphate regulon response regulator PhoB